MSLYAQIKKKYSDFTLDVTVETKNDTLALLGASGCGKSLTLKCIAGIVKPDDGRILLNGVTLFDSEKKINLPTQERKIGYLFQDAALFPHMTVGENVAAGLSGCKQYKKKADKNLKIKEMLERFQLESLQNHKPSQLSGGQQQRTALARMFIGKPEILLLDEPFSALDSFLQADMENLLIRTLEEFKRDTIFVSHSRDEVYRICDRAAVYRQGKIDVSDDVESLFQNPVTITAAQLTGCKNIAAAQVKQDRMYIPEWGTTLSVGNRHIPENITAVGIRAHYFQKKKESGENCIPVKVSHVIKEPFENTIYLRAQQGDGVICYKTDKEIEMITGQEFYLSAAPESIYLLRS